MSLISESSIDADYTRICHELFTLIAPHHWFIKPRKWCWTAAKTKYGMADCAGNIHINRRFLGSHFQSLLEAVLRHELAHLCVGLHHGHNKQFKQCERLFKGQFDATAQHQAKEYAQKVSYKYQLMAELVNGERITLKKTHRKHRNYANYRHNRYKTYYYQQQVIKRFIYIDIG